MPNVSVTFRKSIFIDGTPYVAGSTHNIDEAIISQFPRDTIVPAAEPDPKNDSRTVDEKIADALEDFDGTPSITTLGTVTTGTWNGAAIADSYISSAPTWNAKVSFPGFGTTGTTAAVGNDARLSDARTPLAHNQAWSTITTTPTTLSGYGITDAQGLDSDLTALAGLSSNGLIARTGSGTAATRTITGTTNQVIVSNGDGVAGNPTLALPQDIATTSTPQFAQIGLGAAAYGTYLLNLNGALVHGTSTGVGIGTTSPAARLDLGASTGVVQYIYKDDSANAGLGISLSGGSGELSLFAGAAGDYAGRISFGRRRVDTGAYTERMGIDAASGNVGIGTTSPAARLDLGASTGVVQYIYKDDSANAGLGINLSGGSAELSLFAGADSDGAGRISFGRRRVDTGAYTERMVVDANGNVRFNAYGAGTLQTDSSGNVTASSDASLKTVTGSFTRGLADVLKLTPRTYHWNEKSGMNTEDENVGFIAQEVLGAVPEAVGTMKTTDYEEDDAATGKKARKSKREAAEFLTLSDRPLIAALVNAVKELKAENDDLRARVSALENGKATK